MNTVSRSTPLPLFLVLAVIAVPLAYIGFGQVSGAVNNLPLTLETQGASRVAEALARNIDREVKSGFCPSAVIWPGHTRYDICGFQEGEQQIWQRVVMQLADHLTREGPASDRDADLNPVLASINRPNTWSLLFPSNNTASLLAASVKHLDAYNARLQDHRAGYFPRIDNMASLVSDITSVLGGESHQLSEKAAVTGLYSLSARYAYFHGLGVMAASCFALQAARADFETVLKMQSAETIYDQAMAKTCEKLGKNPSVVVNADDLSHLLTLSGAMAGAVNDLNALQTALAAGPRPR